MEIPVLFDLKYVSNDNNIIIIVTRHVLLLVEYTPNTTKHIRIPQYKENFNCFFRKQLSITNKEIQQIIP